jgi:hypothetical protein
MDIHTSLNFFYHVVATCRTTDHMECIENMKENIIKQYNIEPTSMAIHCMNQSINLHKQYLQAIKPIAHLSADEQVQFWTCDTNISLNN